MPEQDRLQDLIEHDYWASLQLFKLAEAQDQLPEKVGQLISHILAAQHIWIFRIEGETPGMNPWDQIERSQWTRLLEIHFQGLKKLSQREPDTTVSYSNTKGKTFENTTGDILHHLTLHSQYHRGQMAQLLKAEGLDIPGTDYIFYKRG
jgi:uncharacterized damage-inducible protein DinB